MDERTARAELQKWLETLPGQGFFFDHEVPGWSPAISKALDAIAADPTHPVVRVEPTHRNKDFDQNFFCKLWHESWPEEYRGLLPDPEEGSFYIGGPGTGLAGGCALHRLGWSGQRPVRGIYACVGPPKPTPWSYTELLGRDNTRRLKLNWIEVSFIEAVMDYRWADISLGRALDMVRSGNSLLRLTRTGSADPELVRWAAEAEPDQPPEFHRRIRNLCAALQDLKDKQQWSPRQPVSV